MSSKFSGTVALVTGASSGIGYATAHALAELGARVVVVARRKDRLDSLVSAIEQSGGTALAIACDISDRASAEAAVRQTVDCFGRLDILINNAGVMIIGPVVENEVEDWERMISLNQQALLYMTKAALPHLKASAQDGTRRVADIVNISSYAGRVASPNFAVYTMTKFGVNGFTEALRQELASSHVRVGVVEPGAVKTELNDHHKGAIGDDIEAFFASIEALDAEDIADGIAYMVTRPRHAAISELWIMPTEQGHRA
ncbi:SDR family NAD(P)-dependent oxidoreductase [Pseudomonas sp.]|jgi:NADP-dependent 3-hydroxy acid dehydrogenase YdfG|uniref:SDR family NAD(P)-dependent oxidoreductase n=1 Tax=Pseudomonas sp. TaxID=306 RepID=UPI002ED9666B